MIPIQADEIHGFHHETAQVQNVRLHFWIGGDAKGTPVLLWHGFLGTSRSWYKVMPLLAEAGYSVLVPDMRGYGDSDKPAGSDGYDARALAEEFRALAGQLGFGAGKKLLLAAHDMGAPPGFCFGPRIIPTKSQDLSTWKRRQCWKSFWLSLLCTRVRRWRRALCGGGFYRWRPVFRNA